MNNKCLKHGRSFPLFIHQRCQLLPMCTISTAILFCFFLHDLASFLIFSCISFHLFMAVIYLAYFISRLDRRSPLSYDTAHASNVRKDRADYSGAHADDVRLCKIYRTAAPFPCRVVFHTGCNID